MHTSGTFIAALVVVSLSCTHTRPAEPRAGDEAVRDRWLRLDLDGQPVGRTRELVEPGSEGGLVTTTDSQLRLGRLGNVVEMATEVRFEEDADGAPRAVRTRNTLSAQTTTTEVTFAPGTATLREAAGGPTHTRQVPLPMPLLGPQAVRRRCAERLHAKGDALDYATWSAALSAPQRVHVVVDQVEPQTLDGVRVPALRVTSTAESDPAPQVLWLNAEGVEVRAALTLPFGTLVSTQTRKEPALATGELPADFFARSLARSNVRLPGARALERLEARVTVDEAGAPRASSFTVERLHPGQGSTSAEPVADEFLGASVLIDPSEPLVRAIAEEVTRAGGTPWDQARRLTGWVSEHMTFDAGVAFAPAGELARARHGTCAGYAGLLASLLRAARIPARFVLGLVYVGGVFAGHAWVEAHVGGQWVPLDAALPSDGAADAARLAVARDSLASGAGSILNAFGKVIGHAQVTVLAYTPAGRPPVQVAAVEAPYALEGAQYSNPGLGLSLTAPAGYRLTHVDAVWPEPMLVGLEGPGGTLEVRERTAEPGGDLALARALDLEGPARCERAQVSGRPACLAQAHGSARLAFADGPALFVVEARGADAARLVGAVRLSAPRR